MSPTAWLVSLPKRVLPRARANAPAPLADSRRATASHSCAEAPTPLFIALTSNANPPQTYVLAALYALEDAGVATLERALGDRSHEHRCGIFLSRTTEEFESYLALATEAAGYFSRSCSLR